MNVNPTMMNAYDSAGYKLQTNVEAPSDIKKDRIDRVTLSFQAVNRMEKEEPLENRNHKEPQSDVAVSADNDRRNTFEAVA